MKVTARPVLRLAKPADEGVGAPLTKAEKSALATHEQTVTKGLQTFIEIGNAFRAIRDDRLYRETHESFRAYLKDRWEIGQSHAYRLIDAAEVMDGLSPIGEAKLLPANEAQAREFTEVRTADGDLDHKRIQKLWAKVVRQAPTNHDGKKDITAARIGRVVGPSVEEQVFTKNAKKALPAPPTQILSISKQVGEQMEAEELQDGPRGPIGKQVMTKAEYEAAMIEGSAPEKEARIVDDATTAIERACDLIGGSYADWTDISQQRMISRVDRLLSLLNRGPLQRSGRTSPSHRKEAELHCLMDKLKALTDVPHMQYSPLTIRDCVKAIRAILYAS